MITRKYLQLVATVAVIATGLATTGIALASDNGVSSKSHPWNGRQERKDHRKAPKHEGMGDMMKSASGSWQPGMRMHSDKNKGGMDINKLMHKDRKEDKIDFRDPFHHGKIDVQSPFFQAIATALGLTPDQLKTDLDNKQKPADIIKAQGLTNDQYRSKLADALQGAIDSGKIKDNKKLDMFIKRLRTPITNPV